MIFELDSIEQLQDLNLPLHYSTDRALVERDGKLFLFVRGYEETSFVWNLKLFFHKIFRRAKVCRNFDC